VVGEGKDPALIGAGYDFEIDLHEGKFEPPKTDPNNCRLT